MEKKILALFLVLLFVLPFGFAQTTLRVNPVTRIHLIGNGIAINAEDPMDFMNAKAVIGAVKIRDTTVDTTEDGFAVKRMGVLLLDNTRYLLKNVAVSENAEEISAEVYKKDSADPVGKLYVTRYEKPGRDVWAGELSVNERLYNVYFLGLKREFKPLEVAEKIASYCEENPDDEKCKTVVAQCAENPQACKAKITSYCNENSEDQRCTAVKKLYCLRNASDVRCREYLLKTCKENPTAVYCKIHRIGKQTVTAIDPEEIEAITTEAGEVTQAVRRPIVAVRKRWRTLRPPLSVSSVTVNNTVVESANGTDNEDVSGSSQEEALPMED